MRTASQAKSTALGIRKTQPVTRSELHPPDAQTRDKAMMPRSGHDAARKVAAGNIAGNANIPHRTFPTGRRTSGESGLLQRSEWRPLEFGQRYVARVPDVF